MKNSLEIKRLYSEIQYAKEMALDPVMMSDSWRVKIKAYDVADCGLWTKRMRQILDRMDRQFGDRQEYDAETLARMS